MVEEGKLRTKIRKILHRDLILFRFTLTHTLWYGAHVMETLDSTKLNDHGIRMIRMVNYFVFNETHSPDTVKMISKINGRCGGDQLSGTAEEWNTAEGFIHSYWESGGNITPYGPDYDFASLVSEKTYSSHDEGWDFEIYNKEGLGIELVISVTATPVSGPTFDEVLEEVRQRQEKAKKAEAKRAEAKAKAKAEREKAKANVLNKLSPEERKILGI